VACIRCETKTEPCQPNKSMKSWLMGHLIGWASRHSVSRVRIDQLSIRTCSPLMKYRLKLVGVSYL
jgi:hypothetical protein